MAKKLTLEVEFMLPEGVTHMGELFLRLGIRIKQLGEDGVQMSMDNTAVENFRGDLTISNLRVSDV